MKSPLSEGLRKDGGKGESKVVSFVEVEAERVSSSGIDDPNRYILVEEDKEELETQEPPGERPHHETRSEIPFNATSFRCGTPYKYAIPSEEGHDYWTDILRPLEVTDRDQCAAWKDEVQNVLIFASLFSAVVTAFIIESYKDLQPDFNEVAVVLLGRIVTRLDGIANGSVVPFVSDPDPNTVQFTSSSSAVRVNVFWFLSLVASLTTVLIGIVSSQWLREHERYPPHFSPEEKFGLLNMRMEMIEKWRVGVFFSSLPVLLQLALVLFFLGLVDFLLSLGANQVTIPVTIAIALSLLFLLATTVIPASQIFTILSWRSAGVNNVPVPCPYQSPQARLVHLALSSQIGQIFALYAFFPIYHFVDQSVARLMSPDWGKLFHDFIYMHLPRQFRKFLESTRKLFQRRLPRYIWQAELYDHVSTLTSARSWADLDEQWISVRRSYYPPAFAPGGPGFWENGSFAKGIGYGPQYDQIQGIKNVFTRYCYHVGIRQAAYHCFVDCISPPESRPGEVSLIPPLAPFACPYYRAVIQLLDAGDDICLPHAPQADIPNAALLYDEAVLSIAWRLSAEPVDQDTRLELLYRTCRSLDLTSSIDVPIVPSFGSDMAQRLNFLHIMIGRDVNLDFVHPINSNMTSAFRIEYLDSMYNDIAGGVFSAIPHLVCRRRLGLYVADYLLHYRSGIPTEAINMLDHHLKTYWERQGVLAFLGAFVVLDAYGMLSDPENRLYSKNGSISTDISNLARDMHRICEEILSNPETERNQSFILTIAGVWNDPQLEDTLSHLRFGLFSIGRLAGLNTASLPEGVVVVVVGIPAWSKR